MDDQAHAARTMWKFLHDWWTMLPKDRRSLAAADAAIRQARKEVDWLGVLAAQAAQAVLKTYFQAWKNCWDGRADAPDFKGCFRSVMSVDIPQGRDPDRPVPPATYAIPDEDARPTRSDIDALVATFSVRPGAGPSPTG
ncbi:hypothetical protein [Streptomyces sp. ISL-10]|uniref:hypothetical protein n=1 Tax=Streptomyces sp. ISL-10 TaxID=2819172 RepID=UPI0035AB726D